MTATIPRPDAVTASGRYPPIEQRLFGRAARAESGCLEFQGYVSKFGYGFLKLRGRLERAHRVAWMLTHGPIPDGLCVCHRCDNPRCIEPTHLFLGTVAENNRDRHAKGRTRGWTFPGPGILPGMVR